MADVTPPNVPQLQLIHDLAKQQNETLFCLINSLHAGVCATNALCENKVSFLSVWTDCEWTVGFWFKKYFFVVQPLLESCIQYTAYTVNTHLILIKGVKIKWYQENQAKLNQNQRKKHLPWTKIQHVSSEEKVTTAVKYFIHFSPGSLRATAVH